MYSSHCALNGCVDLPHKLRIFISTFINDVCNKNRDNFVINKDYYDVNTRQNINLHIYQVNLAMYGKGVYHMAVKVFNGLPYNLKELSNNPKKFKANLNRSTP
jgi:hypothetical protein